MKPIKYLFALMAIFSMLVCSQSAENGKWERHVNDVGVELRTCQMTITIDFLTLNHVSILLDNNCNKQPSKIDFGDIKKESNFIITNNIVNAIDTPYTYINDISKTGQIKYKGKGNRQLFCGTGSGGMPDWQVITI